MAVYTQVERPALETFLAGYDLGALVDYEGVGEGIENTNYFVTTEAGRFVLTLVEQWAATEVPYFIDLMAWLARRGYPCARPVPDRDGHVLRTLEGRPAAIVDRLAGHSVDAPDLEHCQAVGEALALLHRRGAGFPAVRKDMRGPRWRLQTAKRLYPVLGEDETRLLRDELAFQAAQWFPRAPRGVIHADLFRDNVLFAGHRVSGVIDFYYACNDLLVYDIAVTVNDWCGRADGSLDPPAMREVLAAYAEVRPVEDSEAAAWPAMLRAAALRFWLSRLKDKLFPRGAHLLRIKDPDPLRRILLHRREHTGELVALWREATMVTAGV